MGPAPAAQPAAASAVARHAWRRRWRFRIRHGSRHAHVFRGRQRRGCRYCRHARRVGHGVLAFRPGRRGANPGADQSREGVRHRRGGRHAQGGDRGFLSQPQTEARRGDRSASRKGTQGLDAGCRYSRRAGPRYGRRGAGDATRVRNEILSRSGTAGDRPGGRLSARRTARDGRSAQREVPRSLARFQACVHARGPASTNRRNLPPARPCPDAALHGRRGEQGAGLGRKSRQGHRRRARLFLSRRYRKAYRRVFQAQQRPVAL